jgi:peptidoglycan/xylan/chitin deacetylase (PgdA/CDA1 family)
MPVPTPAPADSPWPDGRAAAVSLTFDDGARSQLANAIPRMEDAGLRGTFYLNPGRGHWDDDAPRWREVGLAGHELGNHTTRHPCSCNYRFHEEFCLEKITLDDMAATIDAAQEALDELHPEGRDGRSFCYPCYQTFVGAGAGRRSYVPVVAERFRAGRGGGERPNAPAVADLHCLMSFAAEESDAERLIAYAEAAVETGGWAVFTFHGVGGDHLAVTSEAFGALTKHLAAQAERLWTAPLIEVADRLRSWRDA